MTTNNNKTILISGGTGLVGSALAKQLKNKGYQLYLLSRSNKSNPLYEKVFQWDVKRGEIDKECLKGVNYIVHLAGAGIADERWTESRKQLIIDSRVNSAKLILDVLKNMEGEKPVFISSSAIGYYGGYTLDKVFTELDLPSKDFLGESCKLWEAAADEFIGIAKRVVKIRTGIVLSNDGGALPKLVTPVKLCIASPLGSGKQHIPWIHIEDIARVFVHAIEKGEISGAYNAVAQSHCTNKTLTKAIAKTLNKPFWPIPVPRLMLKLLFGEMSAAILEGSPVANEKLLNSGFQFKFPELDKALEDLLKLQKKFDR